MRRLAVLALVAACSSRSTTPPAPKPSAKPTPVTITITNKRADAIQVNSQTTCAQLPYAIGDFQLDGQVIGCEEARTGNCPTFGGCPGPTTFELAPGASIEKTWTGTIMDGHELKDGEAAKDCPSYCADWVAPAPGAYEVTATADGGLTAKATLHVPGDTRVDLAFQ
jgi:hypothetical protein